MGGGTCERSRGAGMERLHRLILQWGQSVHYLHSLRSLMDTPVLALGQGLVLGTLIDQLLGHPGAQLLRRLDVGHFLGGVRAQDGADYIVPRITEPTE